MMGTGFFKLLFCVQLFCVAGLVTIEVVEGGHVGAPRETEKNT